MSDSTTNPRLIPKRELDNHPPLMTLAGVRVVKLQHPDDHPVQYIEVIVSEVSEWWLGKEGLSDRIDKEPHHYFMYIPYGNVQYYLSQFERPFEQLSLEAMVRCVVLDSMRLMGSLEKMDPENLVREVLPILSDFFTAERNMIRAANLPYHLIKLTLRDYHPPH